MRQLAVFVASWLAVFHAPWDAVYRACALRPVAVALAALNEVGRARMVTATMALAMALRPTRHAAGRCRGGDRVGAGSAADARLASRVGDYPHWDSVWL